MVDAIHKPAQDIILKPVVSEKKYANSDRGQYTFVVAPNANKVQIKQAIEQIFDVKVAKVNTVNVRGRLKRQGRYEGYTASTKKAVVILKADSKVIEFFESLS